MGVGFRGKRYGALHGGVRGVLSKKNFPSCQYQTDSINC